MLMLAAVEEEEVSKSYGIQKPHIVCGGGAN